MPWWDDQEKIDLLVSMANDIDELYPDQRVVGIGHSPSWLVYTLGQLRKSDGRMKNTALAPFTGAYCMKEDLIHDAGGQNIIRAVYKKPSYSEPPAQEKINAYFNQCAGHIRHMLSLNENGLAARPNSKIVLVDLIVSGNSFMSFVDALGRFTGPRAKEDFSEIYHAHVYKPYFKPHHMQMSVLPGDDEDAHSGTLDINATITSEEEGFLINNISGSKGAWLTKRAPEEDSSIGRFMSVCDPRGTAKAESAKMGNQESIRTIKKRIAQTVKDFHSGNAGSRFEESRMSLKEKSPPKKNAWRHFGPGPHG